MFIFCFPCVISKWSVIAPRLRRGRRTNEIQVAWLRFVVLLMFRCIWDGAEFNALPMSMPRQVAKQTKQFINKKLYNVRRHYTTCGHPRYGVSILSTALHIPHPNVYQLQLRIYSYLKRISFVKLLHLLSAFDDIQKQALCLRGCLWRSLVSKKIFALW